MLGSPERLACRPSLYHAVADGVPGSREALMKGFGWLFGGKEMGVSMLRSDEQMFYRSQAPERELGSTASQTRRSIRNAVLDHPELTERPQSAIWAPPP
jgi:hypothetical protein